ASVDGPYTVTIIATDPAGNTVALTFSWDVEASNADINALLGDSGFPATGPDGGREPANAGTDVFNGFDGIQAEGIVTKTANEVNGLGGIKSVGAKTAVLDAVNGADGLNGSVINGEGVTTPQDFEKNRLDTTNDRFARLGDQYQVVGAEGFSSRLDISGTRSDDPSTDVGQFIVDTFIRNRVLYVEAYDNIDRSNSTGFREFIATLGDGRALPKWISYDEDGIFIVDRPVNVETITLRITGIRDDGRYVTRYVQIDTPTGEMRDLDRAGENFGKSFSATIALADTGENDEVVRKILENQ
ncbi:MAG: hypothetical protein AAFR20_08105, partial [Pseudomonadota bacterium]